MSDETQAERTPGPGDTSAEAVRRAVDIARGLLEAHFTDRGTAWMIEAEGALLAMIARTERAEAERDEALADLCQVAAERNEAEYQCEVALRRGVIDGLGAAAVLAADAAQAARADAARRFLRTSKARDLGAADALARLCDQIGEEIRRRG